MLSARLCLIFYLWSVFSHIAFSENIGVLNDGVGAGGYDVERSVSAAASGATVGAGGYGQALQAALIYGDGAAAGGQNQGAIAASVASSVSRLNSEASQSRISSAASRLISDGVPNLSSLPSVVTNLSSSISASNTAATGVEVMVGVLQEVVTTIKQILKN